MGGGVYDDGPLTFRYSCMSSGSFSNSNHSTDIPSLLSHLKQLPLASTNRKRKMAQDLPAERKCHKRMIRSMLFPSSDRASSPIKSLLFLVESKTCHCTIMLNVLLYCSTIIGRLHSFIVSVRELRFLKSII